MSSSPDGSSGIEVEYTAVFIMVVSSVPDLTVVVYLRVTVLEPTGEPKSRRPDNEHVIVLAPSNRQSPKPVKNVSPVVNNASVMTSPVTQVLLAWVGPGVVPLWCRTLMDHSTKPPTTVSDGFATLMISMLGVSNTAVVTLPLSGGAVGVDET